MSKKANIFTGVRYDSTMAHVLNNKILVFFSIGSIQISKIVKKLFLHIIVIYIAIPLLAIDFFLIKSNNIYLAAKIILRIKHLTFQIKFKTNRLRYQECIYCSNNYELYPSVFFTQYAKTRPKNTNIYVSKKDLYMHNNENKNEYANRMDYVRYVLCL